MQMEIVSDEFFELALESDFQEEYEGTETFIRPWNQESDEDSNPKTVVLDLDLSNYSNGGTTISILNNNVRDIRGILRNLREWVVKYIEGGWTVIALLDTEVTAAGMKSATNYDWLNHLQAGNIVSHNPRSKMKILTDINAIHNYFQFVDWYENGLLLNEQVVSSPEILAINAVDCEAFAAQINEYVDPNGVSRTAPGNLVMLPRPTHPQRDFFSLVHSLSQIGMHYLRRSQKGSNNKELNQSQLSDIILRGESQKIEFKEQIPDYTKKLANEIVALANQSGGILLLGVTDESTVSGLADVEETEERVTGIVRNNIQPKMNLTIQRHELQGEEILTALVPQADQVPYSVDGTFYIRIGTSVEEMTGQELIRRFDV